MVEESTLAETQLPGISVSTEYIEAAISKIQPSSIDQVANPEKPNRVIISSNPAGCQVLFVCCDIVSPSIAAPFII